MKVMITDGKGSFGNAILKRFLETDVKEMRIFSRDEKNSRTCGSLSTSPNSSSASVMSGIMTAFTMS
jgi:FlaA1/EpsC-like NDP-sugar epimerase